jgi:rRNA-processing protein FCF1
VGATSPRSVVLDTGALIALEKGDERVRALLDLALRSDARIVVPVAVIAQAWRGGARQSRLLRLLSDPSVTAEIMYPETARACGVLCGKARTNDVVDASVVVAARRHRALVLTSDPVDIHRLDAGLRVAAI